MTLLPVEDAQAQILSGVKPLPIETVALKDADGRVLARDVKARRDQPPFPASAMDGYAVRHADLSEGLCLKVIGMAAAGHAFKHAVGPGEAVRIFTGAPVPKGADTILIQEDAEALGELVVIKEVPREGYSVRPRGLDFKSGETILKAGLKLHPRAIGLAAALNQPTLPARRKPRVVVFATGDELVLPGQKPKPDQIISSNSFALAAFIRRFGGEVEDLGIIPDTLKATERAIAKARDADILVTTGGASVGDHDHVQEALKRSGVSVGFWRIAMRPGKPLMYGTRKGQRVLGLPGNPVAALVCARIFLKPLVDALLGLPYTDDFIAARLGAPLKENDKRQDYLRARLERAADGTFTATAFGVQDSSMQRLLFEAECLILRPPFAAAAEEGDTVRVLPLA